MAKVVTLTPNPAVDIATAVDALVPSHKLRCGPVRRDPGGGGINVARTVHRLGREAIAVYAAGGGAGEELQDLLDRESLRHIPIPVAAHTRESFNITETRTGNQYRFILPGESLDAHEMDACIGAAIALLAAGDAFVASGGLPPGAADDSYARAFRLARGKGARTVIDSRGEPLRLALDEGVGVLKASARELSDYLGQRPADLRAWRDAARALVAAKKAQIVAVTLGEEGALLASASGCWHATVPRVEAATTVGAGDSFLGGLLVKLLAGAPDDTALRFAAACGTAALMTAGTGLCDPSEADRLAAKIELTPL